MKLKNLLSISAAVVLVVATTVTDSTAQGEFQSIFNGEDLSGWDGDPRFWSVENGVIVGRTSEDTPTEENSFLVWEGGEPANFEARFEYRFVQVGDELGGNSGFQYRSEQFTDDENPALRWRVSGYQADLAANLPWATGINVVEAGSRFILARRGTRVVIDAEGNRTEERFADEEALADVYTNSEWNEYHVYANGDTLRASINGRLFHEVVDGAPEGEDSGIIAFQVHTGPPMRVEFRNIEIRILD